MPFSRSQQRKPRLIRNLFECEATGVRSEHSDRDDDHGHSDRDQSKNSCSSKTLKEESNNEAGKCGRQTSPGINEPNRASPHTGRKQLRLIRVRAIAQKAVHESTQDAECGRTYGSANNLPLTFVFFRDGAPEQGPNGKSESDEKRDLGASRRIIILCVDQ